MQLNMEQHSLIKTQKMNVDLRNAFSDFWFGDFVFRNPETQEEIARIKNLRNYKMLFLPSHQSR